MRGAFVFALAAAGGVWGGWKTKCWGKACVAGGLGPRASESGVARGVRCADPARRGADGSVARCFQRRTEGIWYHARPASQGWESSEDVAEGGVAERAVDDDEEESVRAWWNMVGGAWATSRRGLSFLRVGASKREWPVHELRGLWP